MCACCKPAHTGASGTCDKNHWYIVEAEVLQQGECAWQRGDFGEEVSERVDEVGAHGIQLLCADAHVRA